MKKLLLYLLALLGATGGIAQSIERAVVAGAGTVHQQKGYMLEWTLGEPAVSRLESQAGQLAEGFHQPVVTVSQVLPGSEPYAQTGIRVFPNPTSASVYIQAGVEETQPFSILLFDARGSALPVVVSSSGGTGRELDLNRFPSGVYRLLIRGKDGRVLYSSQIVKH